MAEWTIGKATASGLIGWTIVTDHAIGGPWCGFPYSHGAPHGMRDWSSLLLHHFVHRPALVLVLVRINLLLMLASAGLLIGFATTPDRARRRSSCYVIE